MEVKVTKIFYCYAQEDQQLRDELDAHLAPLRRLRRITSWSDRQVLPGSEWKEEVQSRLDSADIILLLISPNFFASDYCYGVELQHALKRHSIEKAHVIPVILRPVMWRDTPIGDLQALPANGKPVTTWENRDEAFLQVVEGIRRIIKEHVTQSLTQKGIDLAHSKIEMRKKPQVYVPRHNKIIEDSNIPIQIFPQSPTGRKVLVQNDSEIRAIFVKKNKARGFEVDSTNQRRKKPHYGYHYLSVLETLPWFGIVAIAVSVGMIVGIMQIGVGNHRSISNYFGGTSYSIQIGEQDQPNVGQTPPSTLKKSLSMSVDYPVQSLPSINVNFINRVLRAYNSPAINKGQIIYNLGIKYDIDPVYALSFFMYESMLGTVGEATLSLSLGNITCIPNYECHDGYAWFKSWEDGFEAWYNLIRNLYIAQWHLTTLDQIIPRYLSSNDVIASQAIQKIKHCVDKWRGGTVTV